MRPKLRKPARNNTLMYLGVFFIFGSLTILFAFMPPKPMGWMGALSLMLFGGLVSVGWAHAFSSRRYWLLLPLVILPFFAEPLFFNHVARLGVFRVGMDASEMTRKIVLTVLMFVLTSIGFVLFVQFVRAMERGAERAQAELDVAHV